MFGGGDYLTWKEFKKEWNELDPSRKGEIVSFIVLILSATILMIMGATWFHDFGIKLQDDYKVALTGVFLFAIGAFLFNYFYARSHSNRMYRIEDRIEKLGGKE